MILIENLLSACDWRDQIEWQAFRDGVEIYPLHGRLDQGCSAALLKYQAGARVPGHKHIDYEHILVLEGSQQDLNGLYSQGTLVVNEPGSEHTVYSEHGCIVLAIWNAPVSFNNAESQ